MASPFTTKLLPTTMVGSYPRPSWFTHQLLGRDIWEAFKYRPHAEAFEDAVRVVLKDQELAGLDILADGQMWYDTYCGGMGSFVWYWYERIHGFEPSRQTHPLIASGRALPEEMDRWMEFGGCTVSGPASRGPLRVADLFTIARRNTEKPVKMCVGAGPMNLGYHVHYDYYKSQKELAYALAPIFNAEMKELVAAGCTFIQLDELGAWIPVATGNKEDFKWVVDVVNRTLDGVDAKRAWHFCYGNSWGNPAPGVFGGRGYTEVLKHLYDAEVSQFVLDFALRDMSDVSVLKSLPPDREVAAGVINVRATTVETPQMVADRIREVLKVVPAERVYLTTDCGMTHLPRFNALSKLKSLVAGANIVRAELTGEAPPPSVKGGRSRPRRRASQRT